MTIADRPAAPPVHTTGPLYLSRVPLNLRERAVQRDLADCRALHRTILRAFPDLGLGRGIAQQTLASADAALAPDARDDADGDDGADARDGEILSASGARRRFGVLYRVDEDRRGAPIVLVQSSSEPDWSRLSEQFPRYLAGAPDRKDIAPSYAALRDGMTLAFRLRANPTRKVDRRQDRDLNRRNGRRAVLTAEADQLAWLRRKGAQGGFSLVALGGRPDVPDVRVSPVEKVEGRGAPDKRTFGAVTFEGRLRIEDADKLRAALVDGIGSGKAYGFGLLSLAPAGPRDAVATAGTVGR